MTKPTQNDLPYYTYEDTLQWHDKWELIYGLPYAMSPAPAINHQRVSQRIASQLDKLLEDCEACQALLPVDWKITEDTVVQPDNLVICDEPENPNYLTHAPAIIFEILSKSTAQKDRKTKYSLYEAEGVPYYIIVDPKENIAKVYQLKQGHYVKLRDATKEHVLFQIENGCEFEFDFSRIWN